MTSTYYLNVQLCDAVDLQDVETARSLLESGADSNTRIDDIYDDDRVIL